MAISDSCSPRHASQTVSRRRFPYRSPSVRQNTRPQCSLFLSFTSFFYALSTRTMSQIFQSVFNAALDAYENKTKTRLLTHPLTAQLQSCDSPAAILSVLQGLIQQFDHRRRSDERLTNWLSPTISVLYTFSSTIGQGLGLVSRN